VLKLGIIVEAEKETLGWVYSSRPPGAQEAHNELTPAMRGARSLKLDDMNKFSRKTKTFQPNNPNVGNSHPSNYILHTPNVSLKRGLVYGIS
jgi:hypothetical protein